MNTKHFTIGLVLLLGSHCLWAHPSVSLVEDQAGNLYYSDLFRVWRIDPQGGRKVVVDHVHTHELYIDEKGNLYGENLWYNGEALNTWGHFVWRLHPDGKLDTLLGPKAGFLDDYSFVRDDSGYMYWADRFKTTAIRRKLPDGPVQTLFEGKIDHVGWMNVTPAGRLYFVSGTDLCTLDSQGGLQTIISDIAQFRINNPLAALDTRNAVMGIWTWKEYVYVAIASTACIKRWSPRAGLELVYRSPADWIPTGGHIDRHGRLWVLECDHKNEVRVISAQGWKTGLTGGSLITGPFSRHTLLVVFLLLAASMGITAYYLIRRVFRNSQA